MDKDFYTVAEMAELLRVRPGTVRNRLLRRDDSVPPSTVIGRRGCSRSPPTKCGSNGCCSAKRNRGVAAMSLKAMNWAWTIRLPPVPKLVLMALADEADDSGFCFASHRRVAMKCSISDRTVRRMLSALQAAGYLSVEARYRGDRSQSSNGYRLAVADPSDKVTKGVDTHDQGPRTPVTRGVDTHDQGPRTPVTTGVDMRVLRTTNYPLSNPPPPHHATPSREESTADPQAADRGGADFCFPKALSKVQERELRSHFARLSHDAAQQILDELAGRMNTTAVRNPLLYCMSLIDRLERGLFTPELGLQVARRREADRRHEAALRAPPAIPVNAGQTVNSLPDAMRATLERMRLTSAGAKEIPTQNGDESTDFRDLQAPE